MQAIKVGLLAYGMSGKVFHAPFIHHNKLFNFYAVVERTKKQANADYSCISYNSVEELMQDNQVELVIVNTPNNTHFEFAQKALLANKHVLIEKPFSVNAAEAFKLFELAEKLNLKILAYQNRRFDSDFISVKKVIESGKLGKINEVHIRFDRFRNTISPKKFKETNIPGAGIFYDLGAHLVDQAIDLFGIPVEFSKSYATFRKDSEVDDFATAHLIFANQLQVFITTNMLVVKPQPAYVLYGSNGTFSKFRADEQENQLQSGLYYTDKNYGLENHNKEGLLHYFNEKGNIIEEKIPSEQGNYNELFNKVYLTIRENKPYFVARNQIEAQLKILEK